MTLSRLLIAGLLAAATPALADEPILVTTDGLDLTLTDAGFGVLGEVARDEFINRLQNKALEDMSVEVPLFFRAKVEGLKFSVNLKDLKVAPGYDALSLDAMIDNVQVDVAHIRFENWLVPFLGTSCYGTQLNIGNHNDLPLGATIGAMLGDPDYPIELKLQDLRFDLNRGQYASRGPNDCRGPFDIQDYFSRYMLSAILSYARPLISAAIKVEIAKTVPKVEDALNGMTAMMLPVDLPDLVIVPAASFNAGFKPTKLDITPEKLAVRLAMRVQKRETESLARPSRGGQEAASLVYGNFGVNPKFLSDFAAVAMAGGTTPIELYPEMHEFIKILTNRWEVSGFWPDLETTRADGDVLKLWARFVTPPTFALNEAGDSVVMQIPDLELKYQISRDGRWIDYAYLNLQANVGFGFAIEGGQLAVSVRPNGTVSAKSRWAPTYTPADPTINEPLANQLFTTILQLLGGRTKPAFEFPVPVLPVAGRLMTIEGLTVDAPFVKFDLVKGQ